MKRYVLIFFVTPTLHLVEYHWITVYTRKRDGSEYILREDRRGRQRRFTLDEPNRIFFTGGKPL